MIYLDEKQLVLVTSILKKNLPPCRVQVFGSRAHGKNLKPFSDLDLAIILDVPLTIRQLRQLNEAFSNSVLPFRVDIVECLLVSDSFRKIIQEQAVDLI